jgi:MFS family permease
MPLVGGLLSAWLGFPSTLLVCAAIQLAALIEALLFLPETYQPDTESGSPAGLRAALAGLVERVWAASSTRAISLNARVRRLLARADLLAANYLYLLVLFAGDGIIMSTITLYLKQRFGEVLSYGQTALSVASVGGALLALRAVVSAGAAPLAGIWSDRNGQRWSVAAWGALIAVGGCALLGLDGQFWLILLGLTLTAFGVAVVVTVLPAIVSIGSGRQGGLYLGLLNNAGDIGAAVAPLTGYLLLGSLSLATLYLVTGGLLVTGIAAALVARRR